MICCVLLASGFGRRFGSNKLLYELNGKPLYLHALDMLRQLSKRRIDGQEIRVVVVSQYEEIETQACKLGAQAVHNPDAGEGIAASVR
ncbi:MAG: NTP transferase domain-containing protein, partial [Butyricicoccaceae bacterium]